MPTDIGTKRGRVSVLLCELSMMLYIIWLTLPTLQVLGRSYFGAFTVVLFAVGVALDFEMIKEDWLSILLRLICVIALPLILFFLLRRGHADKFYAYFAQNGMFWFPLIWSAIMIRRGKMPHVLQMLCVYLACVLITTIVTIIGDVQLVEAQGIWTTNSRLLARGNVSAEVSRSIMLKGIGGYDFIYAVVLMTPMLCWFISVSRGWKRYLALLYLVIAAVMLVKGMFLYSILFFGAILIVEGLAALFRFIAHKAFRRELSVGCSMLLTLPLFGIAYLLRFPILDLGISLADRMGLGVIEHNLNSVLEMFKGTIDPATNHSRFWYYKDAVNSIFASPMLGGLVKPVKLSQHSDVLDLLAGVGVFGAAAVALLCYLLSQGNLRGARKAPCYAHIVLTLVVLFGLATVGTVTYSRDISLYLSLMFCYAALGAPVPDKISDPITHEA